MSAPAGVVIARSFTGSSFADSMIEDDELTPSQKRFVFTLLVLMLFTGQLGYAVFAPFFPEEADARGVSTTVQGFIFGSFQLVVLICTPVGMKLVPILGPRNLLNGTNFLIGGANVAFGFVWYIEDSLTFTIACFACRIVAGIGVSVAMVVGYGMLPYLFGDKLSTGSSILETAIGLAFIVAPVLGGALYTAAGGDDGRGLGYVVPFWVLGGAQLMLGVYTLSAFPVIPTPSSSDSRIGFFSPRVLLPCILCMVAAGAIEYMSPTLTPMLALPPFNFSIAGVSGVFAACSGVYVIVGPLVGLLDDYTEGCYALPIMGVGMIGLGFGYLFLGPAMFVNDILQLSTLNMWIGILVIGISTALALIPTYNNMYRWAKHVEEDDKANATSVLYNLFYAAGAWLGPTVGGSVGDAVGIPESYTLLGLFSIGSGVVVLVFFLFVRKSEADVAREPSLTESMLPVVDGKIRVTAAGEPIPGREFESAATTSVGDPSYGFPSASASTSAAASPASVCASVS